MQGPFLRKYGEATTVDFVLYETDGVDLKTDAVHASGDTTVMKDEGTEANTTNGFADEGNGYSLALTASEMQAARIVVYIVDQTSPKAWLDQVLVIETYGNASAQHGFDLDAATQSVSVTGIDAGSANKIADHVLRRAFGNAADSSDGDTLSFRSLLGAIAKLVNKVKVDSGTLFIYKHDDASTFGLQTLTTDANAEPVTQLDTS